MGKRRKKKPMDYEDPLSVVGELNLNQADWDIWVEFRKNIWGQRHVGVTVTHLPTKVKRQVWVDSATKRESRPKAVEVTRKSLSEWR